MNTQIEELILELAQARNKSAEAKELRSKLLSDLYATDEWKKLTVEFEGNSSKVSALESDIKFRAKEEYKTSGNLQPHGKVKIKIFSDLVVESLETVVKWAKKNFMAGLRIKADRMDDVRLLVLRSMPDALELDFGKIEGYAKDNAIPGTVWKDRPEAQIASKL